MDEKPTGIDLKTPINASLTAFFIRSFANITVKSRLPAILAQTADILNKKKDDYLRGLPEEAEEDFTNMVGEIGKLKSEIQHNKPMRKLIGTLRDIRMYNKALDLLAINLSNPTYFNSNWLFVECYMYRRIMEAIENSNHFKELDPFRIQKEDAFFRTLQTMSTMASLIGNNGKDVEIEFITLMKMNLWGNKCDLSLYIGRLKYDTQELIELEKYDSNILCNDTQLIWEAVIENTESQIIDIVLDNTAHELFTDLCLADFILKHKFAQQIRFYVKAIPWFMSDVTAKDFQWTLQQLRTSKNSSLKKVGERFHNYMRIKAWTVEEHDFWTLPFTYKDMAKWDLSLYRKLSDAKLIIFKGDVNYRKLFGERNWPATTSVETALQGFHPSKVCVLRTLKSQIICGLPNGVEEDIEVVETDWLITGNYGVIQFCDTIEKR